MHIYGICSMITDVATHFHAFPSGENVDHHKYIEGS